MSYSFATPWTVGCQAPLSMGFPRQEYGSGLPFPSPEDLPNPGIEPHLLHCRQILYHWVIREASMALWEKKTFSQRSPGESLRPPHSRTELRGPHLPITTKPAPNWGVGLLWLIWTNRDVLISLGAHHLLSTLPELISEQNKSACKGKMAAVQPASIWNQRVNSHSLNKYDLWHLHGFWISGMKILYEQDLVLAIAWDHAEQIHGWGAREGHRRHSEVPA